MVLKDIFNRRQSTNRSVLKKALLKDSAALNRTHALLSMPPGTKCMFMPDKTQLYGCGGAPRRYCISGASNYRWDSRYGININLKAGSDRQTESESLILSE